MAKSIVLKTGTRKTSVKRHTITVAVNMVVHHEVKNHESKEQLGKVIKAATVKKATAKKTLSAGEKSSIRIPANKKAELKPKKATSTEPKSPRQVSSKVPGVGLVPASIVKAQSPKKVAARGTVRKRKTNNG